MSRFSRSALQKVEALALWVPKRKGRKEYDEEQLFPRMVMRVAKASAVAPTIIDRFARGRINGHRRRDGKFHLVRHRKAILFKLSAEHIVLTLQTLIVFHLMTATATAVHIYSEKTWSAKIDKKARNKDTDRKRRDERHKTLYKIHNVHS